MSDLSISAFFAKANKYTWDFYNTEYNFGSISIIAFSVEDARQDVLSKLLKISCLASKYTLKKECICKSLSPEDIELRTKHQDLCDELDIEFISKCYCPYIFNYTLSYTVLQSCIKVTLLDLIYQTEPTVSKINIMKLYNCYD